MKTPLGKSSTVPVPADCFSCWDSVRFSLPVLHRVRVDLLQTEFLMRIIDSNTGYEPKIGETFNNVVGRHTLLKVQEGLMTAKALFRVTYAAGSGDPRLDGTTRDVWVPLQVRYIHPAFFLQKVAFIPS
jgi:hypothetical protein